MKISSQLKINSADTKVFLLMLTLVVSILSFSVANAQESHFATDLQSIALDEIADMNVQVSYHQANYIEKYGRYWQGLPTKRMPSQTLEKVISTVRDKPDDVKEDWVDFGIVFRDLLLVQTRCDVYESKKGLGYVLRYFVENRNGDVYEYSVNVGDETWRSHDWTKVTTIK